jgi:serine protease DegS
MGVSVQPFIPDTSQPNVGALLVTQTVANGPADRAGIKPGDIITAINDEPVTDGRIAMHRIALLRPGDIISVTLVDESDNTQNLNVVLGSLQQAPQS